MNWTFFGACELIFYSIWLLSSACFLVSTSRNQLPKQKPFRRSALLLGSSSILLSALAVVVVLTEHMAASEIVRKLQGPFLPVMLALLVSGLLLLWQGRRTALRAADAYPPGKHASSTPQARSRWQRPACRHRRGMATDQQADTGL
jgi:hydrogenase-4 membrane subunit HyfE